MYKIVLKALLAFVSNIVFAECVSFIAKYMNLASTWIICGGERVIPHISTVTFLVLNDRTFLTFHEEEIRRLHNVYL
jgi:hypothetical protein